MNVGPPSHHRYRGIGSDRRRKRVFRTPLSRRTVRFRLPDGFRFARPKSMLRRLRARSGPDPGEPLAAALNDLASGGNPAKALAGAISELAASLPFPGACPIVLPSLAATTIEDPFLVLGVISQSSESVWLRAREPRLEWNTERREVTLWIPPAPGTARLEPWLKKCASPPPRRRFPLFATRR